MSLVEFINSSFKSSRFPPPAAAAGEANYVLRAPLWDDATPGGQHQPPRERLRRDLPHPCVNETPTGSAALSRKNEFAEQGFFVLTLLVLGSLNLGAIALLVQLA